MNTVQSQWDLFQKLAVPSAAPEIQVIEMRRAFYAGVQAMFKILWTISDAALSEDAEVAILEGIQDECQRFAQQVVKGKA